MPSRILCVTSGLAGISFASFELAQRLERLGHRVDYAAPVDVRAIAEANGMKYHQLEPIVFQPEPELPVMKGRFPKARRLLYRWRHLRARKREAVRAVTPVSFIRLTEQLSPDLLIIDVELHEYIMYAVAQNLNVVLLSQWFSLWPASGLPPLLQDTIPGEGFRGSRLGLGLSWWAWRQRRLRAFTKKYVRSGGTNRRSVLKQYAREVGFPLAHIPENYWPGPFTYSGLPVWSMTLREMEFPHPERPGLTYVGPMVGGTRVDPRIPEAARDQLARALAYRSRKRAKLICCTVSSFMAGDVSFLKKVVRAVAGRDDWVLIIGLGSRLSPDALGEVTDNVFPFGWLPQLQVLREADCSINHGGIHTIQECLHFSVPMLVYSGKRSDQNGCAARVHYHRMGIMADKDEDTHTEIEAKITAILEDATYARGMAEMYQRYHSQANDALLREALNSLPLRPRPN